jgi:RNA polymerase sigma-70 factor (ECF subfamily)
MQTVNQLAGTDRDLIVSLGKTGSFDALAELVRRWDKPVYNFLVKAGGDPELAKDVRQEVFMRVFRHASTYDPKYAFTTWLFRIAVNQLRTWQTRERRPDRSAMSLDDMRDDPAFVTGKPSPAREAMNEELKLRVRATLDALSPEERELLLLRFQMEMNYREIGEVLGLPETTAKTRVYALLVRMREPLADLYAAERTTS